MCLGLQFEVQSWKLGIPSLTFQSDFSSFIVQPPPNLNIKSHAILFHLSLPPSLQILFLGLYLRFIYNLSLILVFVFCLLTLPIRYSPSTPPSTPATSTLQLSHPSFHLGKMSTSDQRSEREASENHLAKLLQEAFLTEKVPYNKFQTFLDFKDDATFSSFRRKLESCVEREDCKWSELESDPKKRFSLATRFLTKVGDEYWGNNTEKREKYLTKSDDPDDNCRWPQHREP